MAIIAERKAVRFSHFHRLLEKNNDDTIIVNMVIYLYSYLRLVNIMFSLGRQFTKWICTTNIRQYWLLFMPASNG